MGGSVKCVSLVFMQVSISNADWLFFAKFGCNVISITGHQSVKHQSLSQIFSTTESAKITRFQHR
jgi:hypothetical protein